MPARAARRLVVVIVGLVTVLALAGCQDSGSGAAAGSTTNSSTGSTTGSSASSTSSTSATSAGGSTSSSSSSASRSAGGLPENGKCALIGAATASQLIGATAKGSAATINKASHVDGCTYVSKAGNLGYDVNRFPGQPTTFIAAAKKAAKGPFQVYPVKGGDDSFAFTLAIGGQTMARAEVAAGRYLIAVNTVAADPAQAKRVTQAAIDLLVSAVAKTG